MIEKININGVEYHVTPVAEGELSTGVTVKVDGVIYQLGDPVVATAAEPAATSVEGTIEKISVNGAVYDIADVEAVAAERKRAMEAETAIGNNFSEELGREIDARMSVDNDTRDKGVLFGGFSNRQTTADEVVINYKNIDQKAEGAFAIPAATTEKAGVMSADCKAKLDKIIPNAYVEGLGTIPLCFAYVGWRTELKEITVQKFKGISDTSIIIYLWNGESKTTITLQYSEAIVDGLKYTWRTDQYTIIVDFGRHSSEDSIQTSKKSTFLFKDKCFLKKDYSQKIAEVQHNVDNVTLVKKEKGKYITIDGTVNNTTSSDYYLTSYIYAEAGVRITNARPVPSASYSYIHFFDSNFNHLSYISETVATVTEHILTSDDIPANAKYMRVELRESGNVYAKTLINLDDIAPKALGVPFDYATALSMDKNVLRNAVEAASAGKCTVLYDNDGYPSLMYRIPVMSVGAFSQDLGDFTTPHPAFVVGGVKKNEIYISVFQTCVYNGHYVSWFGLPSIASLGITELRQSISAKGEGWHLETVYERSLLGLLALKYNSPTPRGNTCWGRSSAVGFEYECAKMYNGKLPGNAASGEGEQINGALWINGTQPHAWSHDKSAWGIQDVIGGYHEICDLIKMVDGFLYIAEDNSYSADESTWVNTGVAIDVIAGKGNVFSNSITSSLSASDSYVTTSYDKVECTAGYDTLSEYVRKKMTLLLLAPRLLSSDIDTVLGINGVIQSRPAGVGYIVMGGATEYANSGLGYYNIAYDLSTVPAHNNMGSRMAYIK